jgi:AraC-like DNA-binding protein
MLAFMVPRYPRTRLVRVGNERPSELWQREPHPVLRGMVLELWAGLAADPCRHRVLPNGEVCVMFHLGPPQHLVERDGGHGHELLGTGFVAGLQQRPATYEAFEPMTRVVSARLSPLGAWLLLDNLPQDQLASRVLAVESVLAARSRVTELHQRMQDAPDLGASLAVFERWLASHALEARATPHAAVCAAVHLLSATRGAEPVSGIARQVGLSPRRLRELFLEAVGVSPKRLARLLRFRGTLDHLATKPADDLCELALDLGYYDQAHLNREFRDLARMTPRQYVEAVGDGLDGPYVVDG